MAGIDENPYQSPKSPAEERFVPLRPQSFSRLVVLLLLDWAALVVLIGLVFWNPTSFGGGLVKLALGIAVLVDAGWAFVRLVRSMFRGQQL